MLVQQSINRLMVKFRGPLLAGRGWGEWAAVFYRKGWKKYLERLWGGCLPPSCGFSRVCLLWPKKLELSASGWRWCFLTDLGGLTGSSEWGEGWEVGFPPVSCRPLGISISQFFVRRYKDEAGVYCEVQSGQDMTVTECGYPDLASPMPWVRGKCPISSRMYFLQPLENQILTVEEILKRQPLSCRWGTRGVRWTSVSTYQC